MRVLLLGAGHIGQTIARLLHDSGDYAITAADRNLLALEKLAAKQIQTLTVDIDHPAQLANALHGFDTVVNALPYQYAIQVASLAKTAGCHYFDLTEDVTATRHIKQLANNAQTAFMPQCGLAPGFTALPRIILLVNSLKSIAYKCT
jgi:saccharopine dehydrogenase-like NADP-dependent oxidoreductase